MILLEEMTNDLGKHGSGSTIMRVRSRRLQLGMKVCVNVDSPFPAHSAETRRAGKGLENAGRGDDEVATRA
jgi:hypothetical protein